MPNRKRYVVTVVIDGNTVTEGFTKPAMDALKRLDMVVFRGTRKTSEGTVYEYRRKGGW